MTQSTGNAPDAPDAADQAWTVPIDPANPGVGRRAVVLGAVWSVPVVAVAVASPLAAASTADPTLVFTQLSYTACETLVGVQVRQTTDGTTPAAGQPITVTLSDGYTFADGSTTYTGTSDASGTITLPTITVPEGGGTSAFAASSGSLAAAAPVTGTTPGGAIYSSGGSVVSALPNGLGVRDATAYIRADGDRVAEVLASDGSTWLYNYEQDTWTAYAAGNPNATIINRSMNASGFNAGVLAGGSNLYSSGGAVLATIPNGLTIRDATSYLNAVGDRVAEVLASDGSTWIYNYEQSTWAAFAAGNPDVTIIDRSMNASGFNAGVLAGGSNLYTSAGAVLSTIPNGLTIRDATAYINAVGDRVAEVLASDGSTWIYNDDQNTWTAFAAGNPNVTIIDRSMNESGFSAAVLAGSLGC